MKPTTRRPARTYARVVTGAVALFALLTAATNSTVNPWRVTPVPWQAKGLEPFRGEADHLRTRKAGLLRSGDWRIALVGSSRVANGFDPDHPGWGRDDVVNLGCSAGFLHESTAIARHFLRHEAAEMILLGIDPGDLTAAMDTRPMFDFHQSPFDPDAGIETELRYVFGLSTLDSSLDTLAHAKSGTTGSYGPKGMRRNPPKAGASLLKFIAITMVVKSEMETADAAGPGRPLNQAKLEALRELARECQQSGCRLILFFQANHALMHAEAAHVGTDIVPFEKERRVLVDLVAEVAAGARAGPAVELWDFCNYHPLHCENLPFDQPEDGRMTNWTDLGHFTPRAGAAMLAVMLDWPRANPDWTGIGVRLGPDNLESYLVEIGRGYQRYLTRDGARDLAWKEQVKARAGR